MPGPEDAAAGAAGGAVLGWALDKIPGFIERFRNRQLAFIEDEETIAVVRDSRKGAEFSHFKNYASGSRMRVLLQVGLALRRMDRRGDQEGVQDLREKILHKYQTPGLHLAEAVQSGMLSLIHEELLKMELSENELDEEMQTVFENIDWHVAFIEEASDIDKKANEVQTHINRNYPKVFIVAGSGKAVRIALEIAHQVAREATDYEPSRWQEPENPDLEPDKVAIIFALR